MLTYSISPGVVSDELDSDEDVDNDISEHGSFVALGDVVTISHKWDKYAEVVFIGKVNGFEKIQYGVIINQGVGHANGTVDNIPYFKTQKRYGRFFERSQIHDYSCM